MIISNSMNYDQAFLQFYQTYPDLQSFDLSVRISLIAQFFLGQPYQFEPLGEGINGRYSHLPLYRGDQFDCVTFVDTVLALAHANDIDHFKQIFLQIRYTDGKINYTHRTDWFTDFEWNPNLQRLGYIEDVTVSFLDQQQKPVAMLTKAIINKPAYYAQKTLANLNLPHLPEEAAQQRLAELQAEGKKFTAQESELSYIPLTQLFNAEGQKNTDLWRQFPPVCVVEIVRPNWRPVNPKDKQTDYGTNLNVSHVGIAIHTADEVIFYHAATGNAVVKLPLSDYLAAFLNDERDAAVRGIHIEKIL